MESVNKLEAQYDANQDFAIFGMGDKTKGGIQSLQQKMNMADQLDSSDSEDEKKKPDGFLDG